MYVGDRGIARGRDFTGRLPRFARGPRCTASSGTPTSVDRRRRRYTRATFENSPPIGATLTSVTLADVGTRALRRSPCRRTQRRRGRPQELPTNAHRSVGLRGMPFEPRAATRMGRCTRNDDAEERGDGRTRTDCTRHPEHFVVTRMGHNEMLAELEQSGCQYLTSALIAKGPTCVAKRRNGKSPTGQHRNQERWGCAEGVRPNRLLHFGVGLHTRSMPAA